MNAVRLPKHEVASLFRDTAIANAVAENAGDLNAASTAKDVAAVTAVVRRIAQVYAGWNRATSVAQKRLDWDALFGPVLPDSLANTRIEPAVAHGVPVEWVCAPNARPGRAVMYFHGGGFQVGSLQSHRELMARLSAASGCPVVGVAYRLVPEHRHPAPLHDALAVHSWLAAQGLHANQLALAGDSAGGTIALLLLLALRDAGQPMPAATALMSPWTDLSASGESYATRSAVDPLHQRPMILAMAKSYLSAQLPDIRVERTVAQDLSDPRDPRISPLFADLHGLPPLMIQVGDRETVLSDSTAFADKARAAGVPVALQVWAGMIHVFQQFPDDFPQAQIAINALGEFLARHLQPQATENE